MKQYSKKAIGLILLIVITSLVLAFLVVRYSDFLSSGTTHQKPSDALPQELTEAVEEALQFYKKHLQQKESQLQYFQALANHIDLSVFVYSPETGQVNG